MEKMNQSNSIINQFCYGLSTHSNLVLLSGIPVTHVHLQHYMNHFWFVMGKMNHTTCWMANILNIDLKMNGLSSKVILSFYQFFMDYRLTFLCPKNENSRSGLILKKKCLSLFSRTFWYITNKKELNLS